jgi:GST-like protein
MGDEYTIADITSWPWARNINGFYEAAEVVDYHDFKNVVRWVDTCLARPASQKAINIPARD